MIKIDSCEAIRLNWTLISYLCLCLDGLRIIYTKLDLLQEKTEHSDPFCTATNSTVSFFLFYMNLSSQIKNTVEYILQLKLCRSKERGR
jgi:hypothetical protein